MTALAGAVRLLLSHKLLWLIHLVGNAAALLALWWWLGLRDETAGQVAMSAVAGIVLLLLFAWLHGIAFAAFRSPAGTPVRAPLKRAPLLVLWLAAFVAICWVVLHYIGISPITYVALCTVLLVMLPLASWLAGTHGAGRVYVSWRYYVGWAAVSFIGYVSVMLVAWVPRVEGLKPQLWSLGIRFTLAYAIAVTAWLLLIALIAEVAEVRGKAVAQPAQ